MLISIGLGWASSRVSTNESIWGGPDCCSAQMNAPDKLFRLSINIYNHCSLLFLIEKQAWAAACWFGMAEYDNRSLYYH